MDTNEFSNVYFELLSRLGRSKWISQDDHVYWGPRIMGNFL